MDNLLVYYNFTAFISIGCANTVPSNVIAEIWEHANNKVRQDKKRKVRLSDGF